SRESAIPIAQQSNQRKLSVRVRAVHSQVLLLIAVEIANTEEISGVEIKRTGNWQSERSIAVPQQYLEESYTRAVVAMGHDDVQVFVTIEIPTARAEKVVEPFA